MIRADQLQIGDYVLVSGTPRRVESITKKKIGYHINPQTDKRLYYARLHEVEPIEMTGEILKENGFRYTEPYWICISDFERDFAANIVQVGLWGNLGVLIKAERQFAGYIKSVHSPHSPYIHQLQQACRMCGIKIEWKL